MNTTSSKFDIETPEYQQERHVFDMCRWINEKLAQMEKEDNFDTIYFERKGTNVKKLIEEAIPIACLGLYFFRPADDVYLQCFVGNQPFDATLKVVGFHNMNIKVEVTTIETEDSTLRRQSLSRNGFTYSSGPIKREGRDIVSGPEMVDISEQEDQWVDLIFDRALRKLGMGYGPEVAVLVYVDTPRPVSLEARAELIHRTNWHLLQKQTNIYGVYYCYAAEFVVDGIRQADAL
jgi:hypothetical protein